MANQDLKKSNRNNHSHNFYDEKSLKFYKSAIEDLPALVDLFLPDGTIIFANKQYRRFFGLTPDDFGNFNIFDSIPEQDHNYIKQRINDLNVHHPQQTNENLVIRQDETHRWIRWTNKALFDEQGKIYAYQSLGIDITEEKQLRDDQEKYITILESSTDSIIITDPKGIITYWNAGAQKMSGYTKEEVLGSPISKMYTEKDRPLLEKIINDLLVKETLPQREVTVIKKSGEEMQTLLSLTTLKDSKGKVTHLVGIAKDITEKQKAEYALAESERKLSTLMRNLPGVAYQASAIPPFDILFISQGCEELTGYKPADFNENTKINTDVIHPHDRDQLSASIQKAITDRESFEITYRIITASGHEKCVWERGQAITNDSGQVTHTEGFIIDITSRIKAEQQLRNSEKRYQSVVNDSPVLITRFNADGKIVFANKGYTEYFAGKNGNLVGKNIFNFVPKVEHKRLQEYFDGFCINEPVNTIESFAIRHDGETRWMRWNDRAFFDDEGELLFFQAFGIDFHDQKVTQIKLKESESRFRAFMENFPANAYIKDKDLRHIFINKTTSEFWGIPIEKYAGKTTSEIYPPGLAHELEELDRLVLDNQEIYEREGYYTPTSGNRRYLRDIKFPLTGPYGEKMVGGIALDLTEQKEAEFKLIEQAHFEKLISEISASFLGLSSEAYNEKIVFALKQFCEFFQFDLTKIVFIGDDGKSLITSHQWIENSLGKSQKRKVKECYPFMVEPFRKGEIIIWPHQQDDSTVLTKKNEIALKKDGVKSFAAIPVHFSDLREGGIAFVSFSKSLEFSNETIERLKLFSQIISNAISLKETQNTLQKSEANYRSVVEDTPVLINRKLPDGTITFANSAYARFFGKNPNELHGTNFYDLLPLEERKAAQERIRELSVNNPLHSSETKEIRFDKKARWLRWNVRGLFDHEGNLTTIHSFGVDVTDQHELQNAISLERDKVQSYLELVQTMVIALDINGNINLVNPKACQVLGYSKEELLGKNWFKTCLPENSRKDVMDVFKKALTSEIGSFEYHENPIITKSGEEQIIAWHNSHLLDENKKIIGFLSSGEDITELKKAEKRMQTLLDISSRVTHESFERNPLQTIVSEILHKVPTADAVTIMLLNEKNNMFYVGASKGYLDKNISSFSMKANLGILGLVLQNRKTVIRNDIAQDDLAITNNFPEFNSIKSLIYAPLMYQNKFYGVLCIDNLHTKNAFQESDKLFIESIANQLSGVIENSELFKETQKNREELRALSSRLVSLHENERKLIAMDLHDHFGQILTTLKLSLRADSFIKKNEIEQRERLADVSSIVDELLASAEDLSLRLRPSILDDLGIEKAFTWHFKRYTKQTGIPISAKIDLEKGKRYSNQVELTLYRVMEESLTNAVRHGSPSKINVDLSEDKRNIYMQIIDEGRGFDISSLETTSFNHTGITGLRERINILNGTYEIQSVEGKGTKINVSLPKRI